MANLNLVETTVLVAGQKTHFVELELHQQFYRHHKCNILVDHNAFGEEKWMTNPIKIFNYIGEAVSITMKHKQTGETNVFMGIVSNVSFTGGKSGAQNYILIEAMSDTLKLSGQPTMNSFVNKTLKDIVTEAVGNSGNRATVVVQPEYKNPLYYISQHNESCFDFLNRLSYLYGESFWNDGTTTYWGKPDVQDAVTLTYEVEMTDFNLKASLLPPKFQHFDYLVADDQEWDKQTRKDFPETYGYQRPILFKSEEIFTSEATIPLDASVEDSLSMLKMVDIGRSRKVAEMLVLSGKTQTCKVGIGKVVTVVFPSYMEIDTSAGDFIVTEITHTVDQAGHYSNSFSSVRQALTNVPMPIVPMPIALAQRATVLSNADPKNKGRIKAQFQWQKPLCKETNWIRVLSPDAGGGGEKVASNRGLVTIPEAGDTVMINFEYGDPNRPYSTGSLFTSKTGGGGGQGNKTKSLTTRSGSTVSLDDDKGSVLIKDKHGSDTKITLDGEKNIIIESDISVSIKVGGKESILQMNSDGEIKVGSTKSIEFSVGGSLIEMTENNISISSETIDVLGSQNTIKGNSTINGGNVIIN